MLDPALTALILEQIATRVVVVDRNHRYLYANVEALRFMGLPSERVIGHPMSDVLDERIHRSFVPVLDRVFAGESVHIEGWVWYERQGWRYREQRLVPYAPDGGAVEAVVVCGLDHTEQRLSEQQLALKDEQLRLSEALKTAIVDHSHAALVSIDEDDRIVEFNPAAEIMFGWSRDEVYGLPLGDVLIPQRFRRRHAAAIQRLRDVGVPRILGKRVEMQASRADGREIPVELVLWRTNVEGRTYYTASINDLSERHRAMLEIQRQREALRRSERLSAVGSLLASVAHELNNPLAIVMGRATLLDGRCRDHPDLQREARLIRDAADRCGRIVRTFLNMAHERPPQRRQVSLNDIVRAAAELLAYSYRSHDIELRLELDEALPSVPADEDQLVQIVLNLMINAQQAQASGGGSDRRVVTGTGVDRSLDGRARSVWLRVADNGPGVAPSARERLFESFFTTKPEGIGTGLGLSVSRATAREHGGDLVLEPSASGAVFRLTWPLLEIMNVSPTGTTAAQAFTAQRSPTSVLIVTPDPDLADLVREMLVASDSHISTVQTGAAALDRINAESHDAIVCELHLPDISGPELWRAATARRPELGGRIVLLSGDTLSSDEAAFLKGTGCRTLDKPFLRGEFLGMLAPLLDRTALPGRVAR